MRKFINAHISKNYKFYIAIVKCGSAYRNSIIRNALSDVINDCLMELLTKKSDEEIYEMMTTFNKHKGGLNTNFDGLLIYIINLNLYSKTAPHFKKYARPLEDELEDFNTSDDTDEYPWILDDIIDIILSLKIDYPFKLKLYIEYYGLEAKKKTSYKALRDKYLISLPSIVGIIKEVHSLLKEELKTNDDYGFNL